MQFTIDTGPSAESLVRDAGYADDVLARFIAAAEARRPVEDEGPADLRWGKPSKFNVLAGGGGSVDNIDYVLNGGGGDDEPPPEVPVLEYTEIDKSTSDHRIENPDDPEQYVIVRRRAWSLFEGPEGVLVRFTYNNDDL
jgi:hypothetical protein